MDDRGDESGIGSNFVLNTYLTNSEQQNDTLPHWNHDTATMPHVSDASSFHEDQAGFFTSQHHELTPEEPHDHSHLSISSQDASGSPDRLIPGNAHFKVSDPELHAVLAREHGYNRDIMPKDGKHRTGNHAGHDNCTSNDLASSEDTDDEVKMGTFVGFFKTWNSALEYRSKAAWQPAFPDDTLPSRDAEKLYYVQQVAEAICDTTKMLDRQDAKTQLSQRFKDRVYGQKTIEAGAWRVVQETYILHRHGSVQFDNPDCAPSTLMDKDLNFRERIESICKNLRGFKSICVRAMGHENLINLIAGPRKQLKRNTQNVANNQTKSERLREWSTKDHRAAKRKAEHGSENPESPELEDEPQSKKTKVTPKSVNKRRKSAQSATRTKNRMPNKNGIPAASLTLPNTPKRTEQTESDEDKFPAREAQMSMSAPGPRLIRPESRGSSKAMQATMRRLEHGQPSPSNINDARLGQSPLNRNDAHLGQSPLNRNDARLGHSQINMNDARLRQPSPIHRNVALNLGDHGPHSPINMNFGRHGQPSPVSTNFGHRDQPSTMNPNIVRRGQPSSTHSNAFHDGQPSSMYPNAVRDSQPSSIYSNAVRDGQPSSIYSNAARHGQPSTAPRSARHGQPSPVNPSVARTGNYDSSGYAVDSSYHHHGGYEHHAQPVPPFHDVSYQSGRPMSSKHRSSGPLPHTASSFNDSPRTAKFLGDDRKQRSGNTREHGEQRYTPSQSIGEDFESHNAPPIEAYNVGQPQTTSSASPRGSTQHFTGNSPEQAALGYNNAHPSSPPGAAFTQNSVTNDGDAADLENTVFNPSNLDMYGTNYEWANTDSPMNHAGNIGDGFPGPAAGDGQGLGPWNSDQSQVLGGMDQFYAHPGMNGVEDTVNFQDNSLLGSDWDELDPNKAYEFGNQAF